MDHGELLFSRVLMPDFLTGKGPTQWTLKAPERMLTEVRDGVRGYLRGKSAGLPAVDTGWAFDLPESIPLESFGSVERMPQDVVISFTLTAQRALAYLQGLIRKRPLPGLASKDAGMTAAERAKLRRAAQAVEVPIGCLSVPEQLSADHVDAIRTVYPALYAEAAKIVGEEIQGLKRQLKGREESALSRFLGIPARGLAILNGPDQTQVGSDPSGRGSRGGTPKELELTTPVQRLSLNDK